AQVDETREDAVGRGQLLRRGIAPGLVARGEALGLSRAEPLQFRPARGRAGEQRAHASGGPVGQEELERRGDVVLARWPFYEPETLRARKPRLHHPVEGVPAR